MRDHRPLIRLLAPILVALLLAGLAPVERSNAKSSADELAYGQETGYFFFWDPALISLEEASSDPGVDYWRLTDGQATAEIWAYAEPGVTVQSCIYDFLDDLAASPGTQAIEALPQFGGGPPQIVANTFAPIVITVDGDNGSEKFAADVSCREVVPGESVALAFVYMPAQVYNERKLDTVRVDGFDLFVYDGLHDDRTTAISIPDGTGSGSGKWLRTFLPCNTVVFDLLVEGYGEAGTVTVDPSSLYAVDFAGEVHPVTATAWSLPEARRESVLQLAPGESGLVHGVVELPQLQDIELYFASPTGNAVFLARSILGCGESGAAPVPIDIE